MKKSVKIYILEQHIKNIQEENKNLQSQIEDLKSTSTRRIKINRDEFLYYKNNSK